MKKFFAIALFFIAIGVISSCSTSKSIAGRNLSHLYLEAAENPNQLICNHVNVDDEITRVYWKLNTRGLGISKDEFGEEQLSLTYSYRTFYSYSDPNAIDSGRVVLKDILYNKAEWLMDSIDVRAATGRNYVIELHLIDLNSGKRDQQYISVNKSQSFSNSSFSVKSSSGEMIFEPYIRKP